jgi:hypothetical protein
MGNAENLRERVSLYISTILRYGTRHAKKKSASVGIKCRIRGTAQEVWIPAKCCRWQHLQPSAGSTRWHAPTSCGAPSFPSSLLTIKNNASHHNIQSSSLPERVGYLPCIP